MPRASTTQLPLFETPTTPTVRVMPRTVPDGIAFAADELVVDCFAGGGGASLGIKWALGRGPDIAVNHSAAALTMHRWNSPESKHYIENVWAVDPLAATGGQRVGLLWLSPDCRHFSRAKGGRPVNHNVRGLAWVAVRWASAVRPRLIALENVEAFKTWGPILADGKPCPSRRGKTFRAFVRKLERLGYTVEHRELRGCDYGAPTSRNRLFLIARCDGRPIVWPEPTHGPGRAAPHHTAAECISWELPTPSIFERKKALATNTLRRVAAGVDRFVLKAEHKFIVGSRTDASGVGSAQLAPSLVRVAHGEMTKAGKKRGKGEHALTEPLPTVVASREFALVTPILVPHITKFRTGSVGSAIDAPMPTVTANSYVKRPGGCAPLGLVSATLIQTGYGERKGQAPRVPGLHKPLGTIVAGAVKHAVVEIELVASHMLKLKGTCKDGFPLTEPMHTVQASGLHYAEVRTLLRRMEVLPEESDVATTVIDGVTYAVADIGLRMLTPRELFRAQGFPDSYIIDGRFRGKPMTQTNQVKMCGNSVVPHLAAALVRANFAAVLPAAQERAA